MTSALDIRQEHEHYEISTWLRMLDYQQQENVHMKMRIAEIVKRNVAKNTLEKLEHYQNLFLNKDAVIAFLRKDIMLLGEGENNITPPNGSLAQLRRDAQRMEQEFAMLRREFNGYVCTIINS